MRAIDHFTRLAQENRDWAEKVSRDMDWQARACDLSLAFMRKCLITPIAEAAEQAMAYSYYRSQARQGSYWIDPEARQLWAGFDPEPVES